MVDICILGGGVSGLSLAANLKKDCLIIERNSHAGGLCSSIQEQGFTFDVAGPHILFSKNKKVLEYMKSLLGDNVHQKIRNSKILFKGKFVKYPFENGLADLPKEDCFECIRDYIINDYTKTPTNLEEWAYFTFGKSISEKYFLPYNRKIWNCEPSNISLDWVSRIPKPPMEDVLKSAIGIATEGYLHQLYYFYPKRGGYQSITDAFTEQVKDKLHLNEEILRIEKNDDKWKVTTNKMVIDCQTIVSTIPIHKLLTIWKDAPPEAMPLANKLKFNGLINVLLGVVDRHHIPYGTIYIADPNIESHRITFLKNFSEYNAPPGHDAMMVEITANSTDDIWKLNDQEIIDKMSSQLHRLDLLDKDKIIYSKVVRFTFGYPVCDLTYHDNIHQLYDLIESKGIYLLGRFGQFEYINSDVCVEYALSLADKLNI